MAIPENFPIRIGVQLQPQHSSHYGYIRDAVRRCEDIGVDVAFNWDHFYPLYGDPDGAHFECWTMLGAWAEQTSRIEIGVDAEGLQRVRLRVRHGRQPVG
jgi:alkanesulfonate monooxygenase SsuD/methylene tetrahydromethanopterin reductase-like flavin-dependent oxidoreductase (luciferase family)